MVFPVERVAQTAGVARFAVEELLRGPTPAEQSMGYFSEWTRFQLLGESNCAGEDFSITVQNQVATIKFCKRVQLLGTLSDARADSELRATLMQFPTVTKVIILTNDDHCMFDLSGLDRCKQ